MLWYGWATTYGQAGAEYGKWGKDEFLKMEAEAKAARRGMWKKGITGETPAEYKRRYAQSTSSTEATLKPGDTSKKKRSLIERLFQALGYKKT